MTAKPELKRETTNLQTGETYKQVVPVTSAEDLFERFEKITQAIADRAHDYFLDRGGEFGRDIDDWFKAENELLRPAPIEMTETEDTIRVKACVPGFKADEIEVSVRDNVLAINGISLESAANTEGNTIHREWNSNRFCRQLTLPTNVSAGDVSAELENGVLTVVMPKAPALDAKKIEVKPG